MKHILSACALALGLIAASHAAPPNVLFIAVDDMRCDLGCYGASQVRSPNIDRLAGTSVLFTRAYCQQAVCNASRASIMTGLRPDTIHVWDLVTDFRTHLPDAVTLPQHFRKHGYHASAFGKIYHNTMPDDVSWDEPTFYPKDYAGYSDESQDRLAKFKAKLKSEGVSAEAVARRRGPATEVQWAGDEDTLDGGILAAGIKKLREYASVQQPFFLAVGFIRPHLPFITPKKYWDLYDRAAIPLAPNAWMPRGAPAVAFGDRSMGGFYELQVYMDYADAPSPFFSPLSEAQQRELKHGYYASVSFIDAQVGKLLDTLSGLGLDRNTIVVFWSDHGWKLGEHGGWCKQTNYEIDTRVPFMIRMPGAKGNGRTCDALVEYTDVYPTLCELAGLPLPPQLEGRSLAPLLSDPDTQVHDAAFSQFERTHEGKRYMGYAMRTDRYRYVEWLECEKGAIASRELYDHTGDPDENENVAIRFENADLLAKLSTQMWRELPRPKFPHPILQLKSPQGPKLSADKLAALPWHAPGDGEMPAGNPAGEVQHLLFINQRSAPVDLIWIGPDKAEKSYGRIEPGAQFPMGTRAGAVWLIRDATQKPIGHFVVTRSPGDAAKAVIPSS